MKSKTKVSILLALVIIFLFSIIFNCSLSKNIITNNNYFEFNENDQVQIKQSGFWDLTGSPIFIDDSATGVGGHNWTWAETQPWCSGSGSWTDPYVIENVTIDGQGSGSCIEIRNSDAYFIIQNCSLFNSGFSSDNAGIKLDTIDNGKILNNNCSDNNRNGIYLDESKNNTLSGNTASNNFYTGISLRGGDNNTLSGNIADNNEQGIWLSYNSNNTLSGNTANNNNYGISLDYGNNNTLSGNTASYNNQHGIDLGFSDNNTLTGNTANNNNVGIFIGSSNNNTLSGYTANSNNVGIVLYYGFNNTLSGNFMNFGEIYLYGSLAEVASHSIDKTNLVNNKPVYYYVNEIELESSNFTDAGQIILVNCNNLLISELDGSCIYLYYCVNNTLSGNTAYNSTYGIFLDNSNNNTISGNTPSNNNGIGIYLVYSDNNTISGNTASNNYGYGIALGYSANNTILGNTAINNTYSGIYLYGSDNNTLSGNTISNNSYGIYFDSGNNNLIYKNYFINNGIHALDSGTFNDWNSSIIGNYWDNYTGFDDDLDGIGDTHHNFGTGIDFLPIWNIQSPIYIDDSATGVGAHNWTWAETQPWCSGSGSWTDPYIIENVTIDGQGSGNCIEIRNSDIYFIIRNCSLYNSGSNSDNAAIQLYNIDNGKILNNNCSYNNDIGIYLWNSDNNTLSGNTADNNNYRGISLSYSNNNTLSGNIVSNNYDGIVLSSCNNNTISGNNASFNDDDGIHLSSSDNNTVSENFANNNYYGIFLENSDYSTISGNNASNNDLNGICLREGDNNTISGNTVYSNSRGIYIWDSNNNMLSENLMNFCGIYLEGSLIEVASHSIDKTNLVNNKPVYYCVNETGLGSSNFPDAGQIILINCNNSIISEINISDGSGIYLYYCCNNTISGNNVNNNLVGIYLYYCCNNTISGNNVNNNQYGIWLGYSDNNTISGNIANNNQYGIWLGYSNNNKLSGNNANNNTSGIFLTYTSDNNTISGNNASNNNDFGIYFHNSNNNTISGNTISNNSNGILIDSYSTNNKIALNHFITNDVNARDDGTNNTWDNGFIGNFWSNYAGVDTNDDGIGDTPYIIPGTAISQDHFPIWEDGDDITPNIAINFPLVDNVFGLAAPNYNISINELNLDTMWYTLDDGGTNYTVAGLTGTFNQTAWSILSEGSVSIRFYANDSDGNIGSATVSVKKDISAPVIAINLPLNSSVFGSTAPSFNLRITDVYLDEMWYSLDGGLTNYAITTNASIDQTAWEALSEGNVTISFYANDTAGNIGLVDIDIIKYINSPNITIISPLPDSIIGLLAPNYNITIDELDLDTIWYTLDEGGTNYTITGLTGTLSQTAWEALSEGSLTIRFYANDTAGNIGFKDVEIVKEIPDDPVSGPLISFGNYYILFTVIAILSFVILGKKKKK